jgi:hypothetical protein
VVVVHALPAIPSVNVSAKFPVFVMRSVYVIVDPGLFDCDALAGVSETPRTVFAVEVNVEDANLLGSLCEVPVMITLALAPPEAFDGICTVVVTTRLALDASELTMVGVTVVV